MFQYLILLGICLYCRHLINSNLVPEELTPFACEQLSYAGEVPYLTCLTIAGTCTIKQNQCTYPLNQSDCLYGVVELEGNDRNGNTNNYCISKDLKQYQAKSWYSKLDFWLKFGLYGYMFTAVVLPLLVLIIAFLGVALGFIIAFAAVLFSKLKNKQNQRNQQSEQNQQNLSNQQHQRKQLQNHSDETDETDEDKAIQSAEAGPEQHKKHKKQNKHE